MSPCKINRKDLITILHDTRPTKLNGKGALHQSTKEMTLHPLHRLQLPVMYYRPIKIQSFDNQTSKFTRPIYLPTLHGKRRCILSYAVLKIRMNDRKSKEEFLSDIDCDLLQCAGEIRKKGFTSTVSARYLTEEDLHFLPEGHKRPVLNLVI